MTMTPSLEETPIARLIAIMARLRDPDGGCPWDLEQRFETIAPYTIEEAYEVVDAIERGDMASLRDELGDLLLQVVYHSRLAEELGHFSFDEVASASAEKMLRRHPHVFGSAPAPPGAIEQTDAWETLKAVERGASGNDESALAGVALALPALTRALKIQRRAARSGFDWPERAPVLAKLREEIDELNAELHAESPADRLEDELGDVLFAAVNLARHLDIDPERALKRATAKFSRRFRHVETSASERGISLAEQTPAMLDALWRAAKAEERTDEAGLG